MEKAKGSLYTREPWKNTSFSRRDLVENNEIEIPILEKHGAFFGGICFVWKWVREGELRAGSGISFCYKEQKKPWKKLRAPLCKGSWRVSG